MYYILFKIWGLRKTSSDRDCDTFWSREGDLAVPTYWLYSPSSGLSPLTADTGLSMMLFSSSMVDREVRLDVETVNPNNNWRNPTITFNLLWAMKACRMIFLFYICVFTNIIIKLNLVYNFQVIPPITYQFPYLKCYDEALYHLIQTFTQLTKSIWFHSINNYVTQWNQRFNLKYTLLYAYFKPQLNLFLKSHYSRKAIIFNQHRLITEDQFLTLNPFLDNCVTKWFWNHMKN